jgi:hypothetical protein
MLIIRRWQCPIEVKNISEIENKTLFYLVILISECYQFFESAF